MLLCLEKDDCLVDWTRMAWHGSDMAMATAMADWAYVQERAGTRIKTPDGISSIYPQRDDLSSISSRIYFIQLASSSTSSGERQIGAIMDITDRQTESKQVPTTSLLASCSTLEVLI